MGRRRSFKLVEDQFVEVTVKHKSKGGDKVCLVVKPPMVGEIKYSTTCGKFFPIVTRYQTKSQERLIIAIMVPPCPGVRTRALRRPGKSPERLPYMDLQAHGLQPVGSRRASLRNAAADPVPALDLPEAVRSPPVVDCRPLDLLRRGPLRLDAVERCQVAFQALKDHQLLASSYLMMSACPQNSRAWTTALRCASIC